MTAQVALAFLAGALGAVSAVRLAGELAPAALARMSSAARGASAAVDALLRLGREGREPGALERRQLLICGAAIAFATGALLFGPLAGALVALVAPLAVSRALRARRLAYRRAVECGAPSIARAIADALAGGRSLRGALLEAPSTVGGPAGAELRRIAAELATGQPTETALEALRLRSPSAAIDAIVAAALVQRRAGGNLGALLRRLARACEEEQRLADEVRVATAQARFTGLLVILLPLGGGTLAELVSPGLTAGLLDSALTAFLVCVAIGLQLVAAVLIRRLGTARA